MENLVKHYGTKLKDMEVKDILRAETANFFCSVLKDTGVFK